MDNLIRIFSSNTTPIDLSWLKEGLPFSEVGGRQVRRILCIDAGGVRGLLPLQILKKIEQETNKKVYELFDFIVGAGCSGIIAVASGILRMSMEEIEKYYMDIALRLAKPSAQLGDVLQLLFTLRDNNGVVEQSLRNLVSKRLKSLDLLLTDSLVSSGPKVLLLSTYRTKEIFLFRNYKSEGDSISRYLPLSNEEKLIDALLNTISPFTPTKDKPYLAGELTVTNPTKIALDEALDAFGITPDKLDCIVSLGSGHITSKMLVGVKCKDHFIEVINNVPDPGVTHNHLIEELQKRGLGVVPLYRFDPTIQILDFQNYKRFLTTVGQIAESSIIKLREQRDSWIQLKRLLSGQIDAPQTSELMFSLQKTLSLTHSSLEKQIPSQYEQVPAILPYEEELRQLIFNGNQNADMNYAVNCIHKVSGLPLPDVRFMINKLGNNGKLNLESWILFVSHFSPLEREKKEPVLPGFYQNNEVSIYQDQGPLNNKVHQNLPVSAGTNPNNNFHQNCLSYAIRLLQQPWFRWPSTDKNKSETKLKGTPAGTFIVRFSHSEPALYAIAVSDGINQPIKSWRIRRDDNGKFYLNHQDFFESLYNLVVFYEKHSIDGVAALLNVPTEEKPSWDERYKIPRDLQESNFLIDKDGYQQLTMTPEDKLGYDSLWNLVVRAWTTTMPEELISSIDVIINPVLQTAFENRIKELQSRIGNPAFQPLLHKEGYLQRRQEVLQRMEQYVMFEVDSVKISLLFHGTNKAHEICQSGFAALAITDYGFFGKGIYATPQAEYATRVYSKQSGVCLACFVVLLNPFPILSEDEKKILGGANYGNFDIHYAPVVPKNPGNPKESFYNATKEGQLISAKYDEFVVFQESQILPRFVIHFKLPGQ